MARPGFYKKVDTDGVTFQYLKDIRQFLWDEGPHEIEDVAKHIGVGRSRANDLLTLMKCEGLVECFKRTSHGPRCQVTRKRPSRTYWKLCDHVEV